VLQASEGGENKEGEHAKHKQVIREIQDRRRQSRL